MEITAVKGIGTKSAELLKKLNIYTVEDLIKYYPVNYDLYEEPVYLDEIDNRLVISVYATVMDNLLVRHVRNMDIATVMAEDMRGEKIKLIWFNMPYLRSSIKKGMRFIFRGRIKYSGLLKEFDQPEVYTPSKYQEKLNSLQPLYSLTKGISNNFLVKSITNALGIIKIPEYLPEEFRRKYDLADINYALKKIHFPGNMEELAYARKRLVFDEFFMFIYNMQKLKENEKLIENSFVLDNFSLSDSIIKKLPYELTGAQKRTLEDIRKDVSGAFVMQRLIQGDVGSGKTIIAFLSMIDYASKGIQCALMAPTEVLAEQHYGDFKRLIDENNLDINVYLLTGSLSVRKKKEIYAEIEEKTNAVVIGTHALIQDKVNYKNLGLVVIDEQHRFGVNQRETLMNKGIMPHVISMSATPIPRTLAIILYSDMDISVIDELPSNRKSIKNCVVGKDFRPNAYRFIAGQVKQGRQAYIICPMVEENDTLEAENVIDYSEMLKKTMPSNIRIAYLHGKMKADEKNNIIREFSTGNIDVLVSTTVIEVGINVPNATVMMVENSERFGLSALHQLRGRVGRGEHQSYCIFIATTNNKDKLNKLNILNNSNDGFYVASEDLKLRGPGDFFGIRQSGEMGFQMADIYTDGNVLKEAKNAVDEYMEKGYEELMENYRKRVIY